MKILKAYDQWCLDTLEAILTWLNEWLSISQRTVEKILIAIYVCSPLTQPSRTRILSFALCALIGVLLWMQMILPEAVRATRNLMPGMRSVRLCAQAFGILVIVTPPYTPRLVIPAAMQIVAWVVFQYSTCITNTGHRGRKRALSLAKLKALFGTEWMPQPEMVPR